MFLCFVAYAIISLLNRIYNHLKDGCTIQAFVSLLNLIYNCLKDMFLLYLLYNH